MSWTPTMPTRPTSPIPGKCRKRPLVMTLAASRMLAAVLTTCRVSRHRELHRSGRRSGSLPSATAREMSASVMMPTGAPVCPWVTMRAVASARFIRKATAATWSSWLTVVTGGCMTSATVAGRGAGCGAGAFVDDLLPLQIRSHC